MQKVQLRDKVMFSFRFAIANCEATYNNLHSADHTTLFMYFHS